MNVLPMKRQATSVLLFLCFALLGFGCASTPPSETTPLLDEAPTEQQEDSNQDTGSLPSDTQEDGAPVEALEENSIVDTNPTTESVESTPQPVEKESPVLSESPQEEPSSTETEVVAPPAEESVVLSEPEQTESVEPEPDPEPQSTVKTFTVTAKQWEFIPSVITVNEGDTVRLIVTSTDVAHGISILSFGASARVEPGETVTVEFVADKKGTFSIVCNVFCGSGHGSMKGTLIVE